MKHITVQTIEKAIKKVDNLDDDGLEKLAETYALAQQVLLGYVLSAAQEYENDQLEGLLIYNYCLISETFTQQEIKLKQISEDDIDAFEEPFFVMLDQYFEQDDDSVIDNFCDQPELVKFMMLEITTKDDDGTSLNDETATLLFVIPSSVRKIKTFRLSLLSDLR